ncbi:High mobility group B protein 13 [Camellia lanceoleosa]|uniref:High mobility group B protein 13 n=1 Tax=Camellia lanceoleosa TaxID=1840588 RepID=A0ACC0HU05_9ERIC|nr:High mobility group B protein 13 [Camellia lanceoleosa]
MSPFLAFTTEAMRLLEEKQHLQLKKKEKDPLKPKQPISVFLMFKNERRAALLAEGKGAWEVAEITGEEWNKMTKKQKKPYKKVQLTLSLSLSLSLSATAISYFGNLQIAKQNKEKYLEEMKAYKQRKEEESANLKKEEEARSLAIAQEERENR